MQVADRIADYTGHHREQAKGAECERPPAIPRGNLYIRDHRCPPQSGRRTPGPAAGTMPGAPAVLPGRTPRTPRHGGRRVGLARYCECGTVTMVVPCAV